MCFPLFSVQVCASRLGREEFPRPCRNVFVALGGALPVSFLPFLLKPLALLRAVASHSHCISPRARPFTVTHTQSGVPALQLCSDPRCLPPKVPATLFYHHDSLLWGKYWPFTVILQDQNKNERIKPPTKQRWIFQKGRNLNFELSAMYDLAFLVDRSDDLSQ